MTDSARNSDSLRNVRAALDAQETLLRHGIDVALLDLVTMIETRGTFVGRTRG